jgi:hypothetical protein
MTKRRTRAQITRENRATHAATVAAPIAALRAARRAARDSGSAQEVVTHLVQHAGCSFTEAARQLEHMGLRTPRGNLRWTATQAQREFKRPAIEELRTPRRGGGRSHYERTPRRRAGEWNGPVETKDGMAPWTNVERARIAWRQQATHLPPAEARPPEPLLDSRGRPLKGRLFSKIKKSG